MYQILYITSSLYTWRNRGCGETEETIFFFFFSVFHASSSSFIRYPFIFGFIPEQIYFPEYGFFVLERKDLDLSV